MDLLFVVFAVVAKCYALSVRIADAVYRSESESVILK